MNKLPEDEKSQREKFIETARAIGCDEDEAAFKARLKTLVTAPPPKEEAGSLDLTHKKQKKRPEIK